MVRSATGASSTDENRFDALFVTDMCDLETDPNNCFHLFGINWSRDYLYYCGGFFGGLFGGLAFLMSWNLAKMFGWDEDAQLVIRDFIQWFTSPPTRSE